MATGDHSTVLDLVKMGLPADMSAFNAQMASVGVAQSILAGREEMASYLLRGLISFSKSFDSGVNGDGDDKIIARMELIQNNLRDMAILAEQILAPGCDQPLSAEVRADAQQ